MERCDGEHTVADIAVELGISFQSVWEVVSSAGSKRPGLAEPGTAADKPPRLIFACQAIHSDP